mmetsp:Transcript_83640/g.210813  ORF Transcript_83640/g.210813 Transcript_83640/m.210813 type:complete len:234 (+) Transcript_83640:17-718(+)
MAMQQYLGQGCGNAPMWRARPSTGPCTPKSTPGQVCPEDGRKMVPAALVAADARADRLHRAVQQRICSPASCSWEGAPHLAVRQVPRGRERQRVDDSYGADTAAKGHVDLGGPSFVGAPHHPWRWRPGRPWRGGSSRRDVGDDHAATRAEGSGLLWRGAWSCATAAIAAAPPAGRWGDGGGAGRAASIEVAQAQALDPVDVGQLPRCGRRMRQHAMGSRPLLRTSPGQRGAAH